MSRSTPLLRSRAIRSRPVASAAVLAACVLVAPASACQRPAAAVSAADSEATGHPFGVGAVPPDDFRSDYDPEAELQPVRGGRVTVHLETRPLHLNPMLQSSATARRILLELHARLVQRDWETWELEPRLAASIDVEDVLVLAGGWGEGTDGILFGRVEDAGDAWRVTSGSDANPLAAEEEPVVVAKADVSRVARDTVYTFHLREGVRWHDGHPFDADDVRFSIACYVNPLLPTEHDRHRFERLRHVEVLDPHTLRVFFAEPYFLALETFGGDLTILPRHVFDLTDPDNADHDADATPKERAEYIVRNPANEHWIGLGPYRLTAFSDQAIDAERFADYFEPARAGWVDAIRWRIVTVDTAARQALLEGEFDFFTRLRSRDFLGEFCERPEFADRFEKGFYYTPQMSYVAWNLRRPLFADVRVRRALAHAFDWQEFIDTIGNGMGEQVTASWYRFVPQYDASLEPYPFDLARAEELLLEAGWFDRDGDGRIDRDGRPFEFEYLYASTDAVAQLVGQKLKENLEQLGIGMALEGRDFATRQELVGAREFDAAAMTWILDAVFDPHAEWHSSQADVPRSNNQPGYADPESDALIEAIHAERDDDRRIELYHRLQRRIYEAQPYLFGCVFPTKFAVAKRVRNVQRLFLDPGYSIRRWYVEPDPPSRH